MDDDAPGGRGFMSRARLPVFFSLFFFFAWRHGAVIRSVRRWGLGLGGEASKALGGFMAGGSIGFP